MSVEASAWAWKVETRTTSQKLVLLALADNAAGPDTEEPGVCWPSIRLLASKTGLSERHVKRQLAELAEAGQVIKKRRRRRADGSLSVWVYLVPFNQVPPVAPSADSGIPRGHPGSSLGDMGGKPKGPPMSPQEEPSIEPSIEPSPIALKFENWYELFPKHTGKHDASKLWKKLKPCDRLAAVQALPSWQDYADQHPEGNTYIPNAGRWLRQRMWEDDPPTVTQPDNAHTRSMAVLQRAATRDIFEITGGTE